MLILNYHQISQHSGDSDLFTQTFNTFQAHLRIIKSLKIPIVSLEQALSSEIKHPFSIAFTFDDGHDSDFNLVYPELIRQNIPATFFPIINEIGEAGRLNWHQIRTLVDNGFHLGSHGITHQSFSKLCPSTAKHELTRSKYVLEQNTGNEVLLFAAPFGWYDKLLVKEAINIGYKAVLGTGLGMNTVVPDTQTYVRWNLSKKVSLPFFTQVVGGGGKLRPLTRAEAGVKRYAKQLLGPQLSTMLNTIF